MKVQTKEPLFDGGRIVATRAVAERMNEDAKFVQLCNVALLRHICGDFGAIPEEDTAANLAELEAGCLENGGGRVLSRYHTDGTPESVADFLDGDIYIITNNEAGTVYTCLMYCGEY